MALVPLLGGYVVDLPLPPTPLVTPTTPPVSESESMSALVMRLSIRESWRPVRLLLLLLLEEEGRRSGWLCL